MRRSTQAFCAALCLAFAAPGALAQVEVQTLAAPDLFSTGVRDTGLGADLWRGASAITLRAVLPQLAAKPLSPAARGLARRLLATGANAPEGAGHDDALAAARIEALVALGDAEGAAAVLSRLPNTANSPALSHAVAEAALLRGDDERACTVGQALSQARGEIYWLRLRAFCEARRGDLSAAQLTFDLAQSQARDATYGRLMGAKLNGAPAGAPALRNGLDYALSRDLGLDLTGVQAAPSVAAAQSAAAPTQVRWPVGPATQDSMQAALSAVAAGDLTGAKALRAGMVQDAAGDPLNLALLDALIAAAEGRADGPTLDRLVERGGQGEAKVRARAQNAALLVAALGWPLGPQARGELAAFATAPAKASTASLLALDLAAEQGLKGETGLLALRLSLEGGEAGPALAERVRIVQALRRSGLEQEARDFAIEGLLALR